MPGKDVVIMCTGSQGEPSSILGRLSMGTNRQFDIKDGDTVVLSSHPIPGNEESIYRMINRLFQQGANVIYEVYCERTCFRTCQPGRDETLTAPGTAKIFHSHSRRAASIEAACGIGPGYRHRSGKYPGERERPGDRDHPRMV